jgi:hypothetical protein
LATVASVSNDRRASVSVETRPGILQNALAESYQQMIDDFFGAGAGVFAHSLFQQMLVFRFCTAFRISDGLVVASRGV